VYGLFARVRRRVQGDALSGCPDCGGNKFQFKPAGSDASVDTTAEPPEPADPPDPAGSSSVARTVGKTAATVRDLMSGSDEEEPSVGAPDRTPSAGTTASRPRKRTPPRPAPERHRLARRTSLRDHRRHGTPIPTRPDERRSDDGGAAPTPTEPEPAAEASVPAGHAAQATETSDTADGPSTDEQATEQADFATGPTSKSCGPN